MVAYTLCAACTTGDHENHAYWIQQPLEGVMGGFACRCSGRDECAGNGEKLLRSLFGGCAVSGEEVRAHPLLRRGTGDPPAPTVPDGERQAVQGVMPPERSTAAVHADMRAARRAAPAAPDNAELREALALVLRVHRLDTDRYTGDTMPCVCGEFDGGYLSRHQADALLSGPLAALLAERDDLAAKVAAVRELSAYWDVAEAHPDVMRDDLRRALGAPLTTATDEENDRG